MITEKEAEKIVGRKLKKNEKILVQMFASDDEFKWYKNERGHLAGSKTGREKVQN